MRKISLLIIMVVALLGSLRAQQFPVQVTPQLIAPYTSQVSEYYSPSMASAKINLLLLNRDFNKPVLNVRLRMSIESQGLRLRTREDNPAIFTTIAINAGEPYYVSPAQLAQYFNVNNLEISGMSPQEYTTVGKLPEGFYTFCFEAVEVSTNQTVSNKGCSFAWINLNEPPMLNLPVKGQSVVPAVTPGSQNVLFTWTPRHTASPGAAFNTEYVFTIAQVDDTTIAPEAAFFSSPVFDSAVVSTGSTFLYDNNKRTLIENKVYAWRVQARTKTGIAEIANFKNNGFSEIFWFKYKSNCPLVTGIGSSVVGARATISWLGNPLYLDYKIIYREKNNPDAAWFTSMSNNVQFSIADLKSNKDYEYRVGSACEQGNYNFSATYEFHTLDSNITAVPNCGTEPAIPAPTGSSLSTLALNDTIYAGDFKVLVTKVTSASTPFSGEGYVPVSYLANMKLAVVFNGIGINTDKKLVSGQIQTTYDPTEGGIESVDDYIDYFTAGYGVGSVVTGTVTADTTFTFTIGTISALPLPANYNPATGTVPGGTIPIIITPAGGGAPVTYNAEKLPTTIMDKDGNVYQVDKTGAVTKIGSAGGQQWISTTKTNLVDDDKGLVKFIPTDAAKYAFDEWKEVYKKSNVFNKEYERINTVNNSDYYVSAKAIAPGETDYLKAKVTLTDNTLIPDSIKFVSGKGIIYSAVITKAADTTFKISVMGGPDKDAQEIYAIYPQVGKKTLNLGKCWWRVMEGEP